MSPYRLVFLSKTPVILDIHIDQLHGTNNGTAKLVAFWWLRRGGELVSAHQFSEEQALDEEGYEALIRAEETLLTGLSQAIANTLTSNQAPATQ